MSCFESITRDQYYAALAAVPTDAGKYNPKYIKASYCQQKITIIQVLAPS
jgi:hypothetical protein